MSRPLRPITIEDGTVVCRSGEDDAQQFADRAIMLEDASLVLSKLLDLGPLDLAGRQDEEFLVVLESAETAGDYKGGINEKGRQLLEDAIASSAREEPEKS